MTELFSVLDTAASRYMEIFSGPTIEFAIRSFKEACMKKDHQFAKFPEDYSLFHLGTFDEELGIIEAFAPRKIANATSFIHGRQLDIEEEEKPDAGHGAN